MEVLKIGRKKFMAWLREYPRLEFERGSCDGCPLAIFLGAGCDRDVSVDDPWTSIDGKEYETPKWARDFIEAFDHSREKGKPTAKLALSLLQPH